MLKLNSLFLYYFLPQLLFPLIYFYQSPLFSNNLNINEAAGYIS